MKKTAENTEIPNEVIPQIEFPITQMKNMI